MIVFKNVIGWSRVRMIKYASLIAKTRDELDSTWAKMTAFHLPSQRFCSLCILRVGAKQGHPSCPSPWAKSYMSGDSIKGFHLYAGNFSVLHSEWAGMDGAVGAADASNRYSERGDLFSSTQAVFFFYTICEKLPRYTTVAPSGLMITMIWPWF